MTDRPSLARSATEALKAERVAEVPVRADARADAIEAVARALAARRARTRVRRAFAATVVSLAAVAGIVFAVRSRPSAGAAGGLSTQGSVTVVHGSPASSALAAGDRIVAGTGGHVVLASGTRLVMEQTSELAVQSAGKHAIFEMLRGVVRFEVAKLGSDDRFVVRTADAEVEVRGTVFAVAVVPPEARCANVVTRVTVTEGVVVVRHDKAETKLVAGESWPRCEPAAAAPVPSPSVPLAMSATVATTGSPPPPTPSAKPLPTDLAAQNDLFAEGLAKKRDGDREGAIASFDRLLAKWPNSAHAENAAAERMHLATGPRAVSYAKAYLARFPNGFAAKEARSIAGAP